MLNSTLSNSALSNSALSNSAKSTQIIKKTTEYVAKTRHIILVEINKKIGADILCVTPEYLTPKQCDTYNLHTFTCSNFIHNQGKLLFMVNNTITSYDKKRIYEQMSINDKIIDGIIVSHDIIKSFSTNYSTPAKLGLMYCIYSHILHVTTLVNKIPEKHTLEFSERQYHRAKILAHG